MLRAIAQSDLGFQSTADDGLRIDAGGFGKRPVQSDYIRMCSSEVFVQVDWSNAN